MDGGVFLVKGGSDCSAFAVYAGDGDVPALVGTCTVADGGLVFRPRYGVAPGMRVRAIARKLKRSPSTVCREISRQPYARELPYEATRADDHADHMRWQCRNPRKLKNGSALFSFVQTPRSLFMWRILPGS
jgi:hypothetical protein